MKINGDIFEFLLEELEKTEHLLKKSWENQGELLENTEEEKQEITRKISNIQLWKSQISCIFQEIQEDFTVEKMGIGNDENSFSMSKTSKSPQKMIISSKESPKEPKKSPNMPHATIPACDVAQIQEDFQLISSPILENSEEFSGNSTLESEKKHVKTNKSNRESAIASGRNRECSYELTLFGERYRLSELHDSFVKFCQILIQKCPQQGEFFHYLSDFDTEEGRIFSFFQSDIRGQGTRLPNGLLVTNQLNFRETRAICEKIMCICGFYETDCSLVRKWK